MEIIERVESTVKQMKVDMLEQLSTKLNKNDFLSDIKGFLSF